MPIQIIVCTLDHAKTVDRRGIGGDPNRAEDAAHLGMRGVDAAIDDRDPYPVRRAVAERPVTVDVQALHHRADEGRALRTGRR